jgi:hypothetical protein
MSQLRSVLFPVATVENLKLETHRSPIVEAAGVH